MTDSFWGWGTLRNGKMIVINGGFSKACQPTTGIVGYTLLYNSYGMQFVVQKHFNSKGEVLHRDRCLNGETNVGEELLKEMAVGVSVYKVRRYEIQILYSLSLFLGYTESDYNTDLW